MSLDLVFLLGVSRLAALRGVQSLLVQKSSAHVLLVVRQWLIRLPRTVRIPVGASASVVEEFALPVACDELYWSLLNNLKNRYVYLLCVCSISKSRDTLIILSKGLRETEISRSVSLITERSTARRKRSHLCGPSRAVARQVHVGHVGQE